MINVEEALKLVEQNSSPLKSEIILLNKALGRSLSKNITSNINMPPFRQSAMDGYAMNASDQNNFTVIGEVAAGSAESFDLRDGEAVRIFTGARVPDSANIVIPQEKIQVDDNLISTEDQYKNGQHIRPLGEQIREGEVGLKQGLKLDAASIGFLATLGLTEVEVIKLPKISILVTGDELIKPGMSLEIGKIYESNSAMLEAAVNKFGFCQSETIYVPDNYEETKNKIIQAIDESDVLIMTGGISVGDYDFVGKALEEIGAEAIFYKVKQKPGKPIYFGKHKSTSIFALPGNPAAALTSFYIYVLPLLNTLKGQEFNGLRTSMSILDSDYTKKGDRSQFLKGIEKNGVVQVLDGQASSMLHTFSLANALIYIPIESAFTKKGEAVVTYHID